MKLGNVTGTGIVMRPGIVLRVGNDLLFEVAKRPGTLTRTGSGIGIGIGIAYEAATGKEPARKAGNVRAS